MPVPVRFFIGSPRRLLAAIVLFVLLDLTVLVINLWIAAQVAEDAVAINLAGRQRMLSQQTTKALLLAHHAPDNETRQAALAELAKAFTLFQTTLHAFAAGGETLGGDGKPVYLQRVQMDAGRVPIEHTLHHIAPLAERLHVLHSGRPLADADTAWAVAYMTRENRDILAQMNQLTSVLEQHSVRRVQSLRAIQTGAFVLALANFLVIVLGLVRQYRHVEQDSQRWREMAQRDPLTGLHNRRAFMAALEQALQTANTERKTLAVLMLDLDGFKQVNDQHGHAVGDELLRTVTASLLHHARDTVVVARLGGDEFALLCPNLHGDEAVQHFCTRLIAGMDTYAITPEQRGQISASLGVALFPEHGTDTEEILAAADKAMYRSKRQGGAQWTLATLNR